MFPGGGTGCEYERTHQLELAPRQCIERGVVDVCLDQGERDNACMGSAVDT